MKTPGYPSREPGFEVVRHRLWSMAVVSSGDRLPIQSWMNSGWTFPQRKCYWTHHDTLPVPLEFWGQELSLWAWPHVLFGMTQKRLDRWEDHVRNACGTATINGYLCCKNYFELPAMSVLNVLRRRPRAARRSAPSITRM